MPRCGKRTAERQLPKIGLLLVAESDLLLNGPCWKEIGSDVWVVAASNVCIEELTRDGLVICKAKPRMQAHYTQLQYHLDCAVCSDIMLQIQVSMLALRWRPTMCNHTPSNAASVATCSAKWRVPSPRTASIADVLTGKHWL